MKRLHVIGELSFIIGVVLAIIFGAFYEILNITAIYGVFVILGIIIGLLNITEKEIDRFLIAAVALLLTGTAGLQVIPIVGKFIGPIFTNIISFVAPATVIVALKAIYNVAIDVKRFFFPIIKRDGTLQIFMKDKIVKSCIKCGASEGIAVKVANEVAEKAEKNISTKEIGEMVIDSLRAYDKKASECYEKEFRKKWGKVR